MLELLVGAVLVMLPGLSGWAVGWVVGLGCLGSWGGLLGVGCPVVLLGVVEWGLRGVEFGWAGLSGAVWGGVRLSEVDLCRCLSFKWVGCLGVWVEWGGVGVECGGAGWRRECPSASVLV